MGIHFDFIIQNRTKNLCIYIEIYETHIAIEKRKLKPKIYYKQTHCVWLQKKLSQTYKLSHKFFHLTFNFIHKFYFFIIILVRLAVFISNFFFHQTNFFTNICKLRKSIQNLNCTQTIDEIFFVVVGFSSLNKYER